MRLVRFIAASGFCSRRKSAELIKQGVVTINDVMVSDPAYLVEAGDIVRCQGTVCQLEEPHYFMLYKPEGVVSAVSDRNGEATVSDLMKPYSSARLYPVGRLDKATTGLLLMTNDGDLSYKSTHPKFEISKLYRVTLDKPLKMDDRERLLSGIDLEDGTVSADTLVSADTSDKRVWDISLHSGKNRIIRRMMGHCGYTVRKLHRYMFADLVLTDVMPGEARPLTALELDKLKKRLSL
jgi:23S rRNA pseudouridine2605 synthase